MTKEQIYKKHVEQFFAKNRSCRFDDIPMSVFTDMMEEYANERLKNNSRLENVSNSVPNTPSCPSCESKILREADGFSHNNFLECCSCYELISKASLV